MTRKEMLMETEKCVCGDREVQYGVPENNFKKISDLWTAYSGNPYTPLDVAMYLSLLKVARISTGQVKEDNFVDLAGYAACGCEIASKNKEKRLLTCAELVEKYYGDSFDLKECCQTRECIDCPLHGRESECCEDIEESNELYEALTEDICRLTGLTLEQIIYAEK